MPCIAARDQIGSRLKVRLLPDLQLDPRWLPLPALLVQLARRYIHEQPAVSLESFVVERARQRATHLQQQLRLDPRDTGSLLQGFDDMHQQVLLQVDAFFRQRRTGEAIPYDRLVPLVYKERIRRDRPALMQGVTRQDAG